MAFCKCKKTHRFPPPFPLVSKDVTAHQIVKMSSEFLPLQVSVQWTNHPEAGGGQAVSGCCRAGLGQECRLIPVLSRPGPVSPTRPSALSESRAPGFASCVVRSPPASRASADSDCRGLGRGPLTSSGDADAVGSACHTVRRTELGQDVHAGFPVLSKMLPLTTSHKFGKC